jgi:ubiquitin-protein ligase
VAPSPYWIEVSTVVMRPRDRRLQSEHEEMLELARSSSMVSFTSAGVPPTQYSVTLTCQGLWLFDGVVATTDTHEFEITLTENFPLVPPLIVWLTPVFHPNIKPPHVCSGDIWYPAMSLAAFVVELCELVQYKSFNMYDPLNEEASIWLSTVLRSDVPLVPIDPRPVIDIDFEIGIVPQTADGGGGDDAG